MNSLKLLKRRGEEKENRSKQIFSFAKSEIVFQSNFPKQKKEMMSVFRVQGVWLGAF